MSKTLNKPQHYAETGALLEDQWYLHYVSISGIRIYIKNKISTPYTRIQDLYKAAMKDGYAAWYYKGAYNSNQIIGFDYVPVDENASEFRFFYYTGERMQTITKSEGLSVSDTVTPY